MLTVKQWQKFLEMLPPTKIIESLEHDHGTEWDDKVGNKGAKRVEVCAGQIQFLVEVEPGVFRWEYSRIPICEGVKEANT